MIFDYGENKRLNRLIERYKCIKLEENLQNVMSENGKCSLSKKSENLVCYCT